MCYNINNIILLKKKKNAIGNIIFFQISSSVVTCVGFDLKTYGTAYTLYLPTYPKTSTLPTKLSTTCDFRGSINNIYNKVGALYLHYFGVYGKMCKQNCFTTVCDVEQEVIMKSEFA